MWLNPGLAKAGEQAQPLSFGVFTNEQRNAPHHAAPPAPQVVVTEGGKPVAGGKALTAAEAEAKLAARRSEVRGVGMGWVGAGWGIRDRANGVSAGCGGVQESSSWS